VTSLVIDRNQLFGPTGQLARVPRRIGRILRAQAARRELSIDRRQAPGILLAIAAVRPDAANWVTQESRVGDPSILVVGPRAGGPAAIVRIARSATAQDGLARAATALDELHERLVEPDVDALLPGSIASGTLAGRTWLAESALPGESGRTVLDDPVRRRAMLAATTGAIVAIHAATAGRVVVDDAVIDRWVSARTGIIDAALTRRPSRASAERRLLATIASTIASDLRGRTLDIGWIHGDLWPANVLVTGDGGSISGIVDWDSAERDELALHDRLHLAVTTRRLVERKDAGAVIAGLLAHGTWSDDDRLVLDLPAANGGGLTTGTSQGLSSLPARIALWLYWLRFVESNLARRPALATDRAWLAANVRQVLACA
jgi:hypothetical protein